MRNNTIDEFGNESGSATERQEKKKKDMKLAKLMRVTEVDQRLNTPAYQRFMQGDPTYFYKETGKKKKV